MSLLSGAVCAVSCLDVDGGAGRGTVLQFVFIFWRACRPRILGSNLANLNNGDLLSSQRMSRRSGQPPASISLRRFYPPRPGRCRGIPGVTPSRARGGNRPAWRGRLVSSDAEGIRTTFGRPSLRRSAACVTSCRLYQPTLERSRLLTFHIVPLL